MSDTIITQLFVLSRFGVDVKYRLHNVVSAKVDHISLAWAGSTLGKHQYEGLPFGFNIRSNPAFRNFVPTANTILRQLNNSIDDYSVRINTP